MPEPVNEYSPSRPRYPFPSDEGEPQLVQIFKQAGEMPCVHGFRGNPIEVLDEIQRDYIDDDELHSDLFASGDGDYLFRIVHQPGQQTFPETGQWDFLPYTELSLVRFRPLAALGRRIQQERRTTSEVYDCGCEGTPGNRWPFHDGP